jgi:glycosyltransferase involved in cell wall biosynthesis
MFSRVRVIVREDLRRRRNHGFERFLDNLADPAMTILAPAEMGWDPLVSIADAVLIPADGPVPVGAALHAMAAGVPVIGTPIPIVRELIDDRRTGLVASTLKPRALVSPIDEVLNNSALRRHIVTNALEEIRTRRSPAAFVASFQNLYAQGIPARTLEAVR